MPEGEGLASQAGGWGEREGTGRQREDRETAQRSERQGETQRQGQTENTRRDKGRETKIEADDGEASRERPDSDRKGASPLQSLAEGRGNDTERKLKATSAAQMALSPAVP